MSYTINLDIRPFEAAADIAGYRVVAGSGSGAKVRAGAAAADKIAGVSERMGAKGGGILDVIVHGRTQAVAGAAFAAFDQLTTDAQGRVVKVVPVNGTVLRTVGFAQEEAVQAGDIVWIHVVLGSIG